MKLIIILCENHCFPNTYRSQIMEPNIYATNTSCIEIQPTTVVYCELRKIEVLDRTLGDT